MRKTLFLILLLPVSVFADAPIDLSTTGSSLTSYIAGAASAAIPLLLALWGLVVIIKAFLAVLFPNELAVQREIDSGPNQEIGDDEPLTEEELDYLPEGFDADHQDI